jgi:hypothetical protein
MDFGSPGKRPKMGPAESAARVLRAIRETAKSKAEDPFAGPVICLQTTGAESAGGENI